MRTSVVVVALLALVGCSETTTGDGGSGGSMGDVFPCTEQGIVDAIAEGGGPHFFACDGPTTVVTVEEIAIDNDVVLDGEGELTVDGNEDHRVFSVETGVEAELRGVEVTRGVAGFVALDAGDGGGGISSRGTLTLTDSTVSGNAAGYDGGGIRNYATLTLTNSTVSGNAAGYDGGGIASDGTLALTNSTVSENAAGHDGGGISSRGTLTLTNGTVSGNTATGSGGISSSGTLALTNSTVSENTAERDGGGIGNGGTLTLANSTVSGNTAGGRGGGIWNWPGATLTNSTLTNSTVSGNTAGHGGGGIWNWPGATLTLTNSTVSGNTAELLDGGGIRNESTLTLTNTLIDDVCTTWLDGITTTGGGNLESPGNTCGFNPVTDQVSVSAEDLNLGELAANGGPTMTHKLGDGGLGEGSVAIDAIPGDACDVTEDQRGQPRPETGGTMCDVGAFEVQP
jgi:predicted outer membrane repeat protein